MASMNDFDNVLAGAIADLAEKPTWFSEGDVQSDVYKKLSEIEELKESIPTAVSIGMNQHGEMSKTTYKTRRLHREYGINGIDKARADLVVFDKDDIKNINDLLSLRTEKNKDAYLQPEIIIEFGTEKSAGSAADFKNHIKADIDKATTAKKKGYIIHLQRTYTTNADIKKYENDYLPVLNELEYDKSKIKILFLLISIGCEKGIFNVGKVQLYKDGKLTGINMKKYTDEIFNVLKD